MHNTFGGGLVFALKNRLGLISADITNGDEFLTLLFTQQLMDLPLGNNPPLKQLPHIKLLNMI